MQKTDFIPDLEAVKEENEYDKRRYEKNIRILIGIISENNITLLDEIYSNNKQREYLKNTIKTLKVNKEAPILQIFEREKGMHSWYFDLNSRKNPDITKQMLRKLVDYSIEDINYQDKNSMTTLMEFLIGTMHEREAMMILDFKHLDINKQCFDLGGWSALMITKSRNKTLIDKLFSHDPEVDLKDNDGITAIIYACYDNNTYLVKKILECNPDLSIKYNHFLCNQSFSPGITVIDYGSKEGNNMNKDIYKMLINYRRVPESLKNIVIKVLKKKENKSEMEKLLKLSSEETFSLLTKPTNRKLNRDRTLKLYGEKK